MGTSTARSRLGDSLKSAGIAAWQMRLPLALLAAAFSGWLASTWFQAPERQLQDLSEAMQRIDAAGQTKAQAEEMGAAEVALEERLKKQEPLFDFIQTDVRSSCVTFCHVEWEARTSTKVQSALKNVKVDKRFTIHVTVAVQPFPADARPKVLPNRYLWRDTEWSWYVSSWAGPGTDAQHWKGSFAGDQPEVVLAGFPEVAKVIRLAQARMAQSLNRSNDRYRVPLGG